MTLSLYPTPEDILAFEGTETHAAVCVRIFADTQTPISLFQTLSTKEKNAFLLESVENGSSTGRYSFIGAAPHSYITFQDSIATIHQDASVSTTAFDDPLDIIETHLNKKSVWVPKELPRFVGGAVGYLGFDCIRYFERIPIPQTRSIEIPEGVFLLCDDPCIYDHLRRTISFVKIISLAGDRRATVDETLRELEERVHALTSAQHGADAFRALDAGPQPAQVTIEMTHHTSQQDMEDVVRSCQEAIRNGEVFQIVPSQRFTVHEHIDPLDLYRVLRSLNPSPYHFLLHFEEFQVVGSSPEVLVRVDHDEILIRPIAGTRPRSSCPEEERQLEKDLLGDEKERAEHRMLVDLGRNDLGKVSAIGTVEVDDYMHIEKYSHVMHIVSDVISKRSSSSTVFDVFRSCFPAGTVSGAPKIRACELLSQLEKMRRGLYAGAVGYFGYNNAMDTCIAIRTLVVEKNQTHIQAGAGIVFDSIPEKEHLECLHKAKAALLAIQRCLHLEGTQ